MGPWRSGVDLDPQPGVSTASLSISTLTARMLALRARIAACCFLTVFFSAAI
jgi:hypothetical protein